MVVRGQTVRIAAQLHRQLAFKPVVLVDTLFAGRLLTIDAPLGIDVGFTS